MPYKTKAIANALINKAASKNERLSPLKLQKLMYYACGYYYAAFQKPLIDSPIEAWEYGPVISEIYHEFKDFGSKPITRLATELDWDTGALVPVAVPTNDAALEKLLSFIWDNYGKLSGLQLSEMTHSPNSPWDRTRKEKPGIRGADIPDVYLAEYFGPFVKRKAA